MHRVPLAPLAALLAALLIALPPSVFAAGPQDHASSSVIPSVGTRTDLALPPVKAPPASPPAGQRASTWRALDGKAFEQAKAAADAAAQGGSARPRRTAHLTLAKSVVNTGGGTAVATNWTLTASAGSTVVLSGAGGASGNLTAGTYTLAESAGPANYRPSAWTCTGVTPSGNSIILTAGLTATCTITNTYSPPPPNPAHLTLAKSVVNTGGGTAVATNWTLTASAGSTVVLSGAGGASGDLTAGTYALAESAGPANYSPSAWTCTGVTPSGNSITLTAGLTASCTITNTYGPPGGPTASPSWPGEYQGGLAPPDPTGAIGPTSYIELINLRYGIYDRNGKLLPYSGSEGDFAALMGLPVSNLSDPQILWDPGAQRFYYLALDVASDGFAFGYSTSPSPQSGADFCKYILDFGYGSTLPDYPKLGVTNDFVLIGSNDFVLASIYNGSNVNWMAKPTNSICPGSIGPGGTFASLKNVGGSLMSTPVPAVAADPVSGGWVVGSADVSTGSANFLTVFHVAKDSVSGYATISAPTAIGVTSYAMPPNAPELGASQLQDTMDTRLTHAVAGYDPRLGLTAIWTAHTVLSGAGWSEGRWYEINTGTLRVAQAGQVTDANLYVWNGAVSPDRAADDVTGAGAVTGSAMVMGFNTSSATTYPALQMVSQRGTGAESAFALIHQSPGPNVDFSCTGGSTGNVCRWGDYGGATPDPLVASGGRVWLSGEWNLAAATNGTQPVWRTWNWSATP
jgi:hypothetical protein